MTVQSYQFNERLAMSCGVSTDATVGDILTTNIPGALAAYPAHSVNDRNGTDWWVEHSSGRHLSVDCKVRDTDWQATHPEEDDLALETWSVVEAQKQGWTRDSTKRTDYILWLWRDTGRWCLVPFHLLCAVFSENWEGWRNAYKTRRQHTPGYGNGYHSECVFVPRREVWGAIYRRFSGSPNSKTKGPKHQ